MLPSFNPEHVKRLLLKISGEMLMEGQPFGINAAACNALALALANFVEKGLQLGVVIGGGNIFRGCHLQEIGVARTPADQMGMLATVMNGLALQQALEKHNCKARLLSALDCPKIAETYTWNKAMHCLADNAVTLFVGGTGNPYFTTDTAAALRASEIGADLFLKATKVDGIYTKDPLKYAGASKYATISYSQMLSENLAVMDATAVALCRQNRIPILVFNMQRLKEPQPADILKEWQTGTLVYEPQGEI